MKQKTLCCVIAVLLCISCLATGCFTDKNPVKPSPSSTPNSTESSDPSEPSQPTPDTPSTPETPDVSDTPDAPVVPDKPNGTTNTSSGSSGNKHVQYNYKPIDDMNVLVPAGAKSTQKWIATDIELTAAKTYVNPYLNQAINCQFTGPQGQKMTIPGYWDGGQKWVIRFAPPVVGKWTYTVSAADKADAGLHNVKGEP